MIPATDVQERSFRQGRQGDSVRPNDDLNCDERSLIGREERPLIVRNLNLGFRCNAAKAPHTTLVFIPA
jgi:hypothetical protein